MVAAGHNPWLQITILSESPNCRKNGLAQLAFLCILPHTLSVWEYCPMLLVVRSVYPYSRRTRMVTVGAFSTQAGPYGLGNTEQPSMIEMSAAT